LSFEHVEKAPRLSPRSSNESQNGKRKVNEHAAQAAPTGLRSHSISFAVAAPRRLI
jgi:hypothetical protein